MKMYTLQNPKINLKLQQVYIKYHHIRAYLNIMPTPGHVFELIQNLLCALTLCICATAPTRNDDLALTVAGRTTT